MQLESKGRTECNEARRKYKHIPVTIVIRKGFLTLRYITPCTANTDNGIILLPGQFMAESGHPTACHCGGQSSIPRSVYLRSVLGKGRTGTEFSPGNSGFPCQYFSANAPHSWKLPFSGIWPRVCIYIYIQGVTGGKDQTSGGCSLC